MSLSELDIPSNQKFGFFLTGIFFLVTCFCWFYLSPNATIAFLIISAGVLLITLFHADLLLPINKLWMGFGLLLGKIISPIVLGFIFFFLFTPLAIILRFFKRDELRLRFEKKNSHWIKRDAPLQYESFKNQF
jgi:hypothetical protein